MSKAPFRTVGIYTKPLRDGSPGLIHRLLEFLTGRGIQIRLDEQTATSVRREDLLVPGDQIPAQVDLVVVLGGDGTMLSVVRKVGTRPVPILGINFGSLGFLTEVPQEGMIHALQEIFDGKYRLESRMKLEVEVLRDGKSAGHFRALNDAVINKGALARIFDMEVFVDQQFLTVYKADGLIVSTPTGSTAYSLSAGGPIMAPTQRGLILSPICPHTLTHRPLVLDGVNNITIRLVSGEAIMLTVDGQTGIPLYKDDVVRVFRSEHDTHLVFPHDQNFFDVLRQKLKWGEREGFDRNPGEL